MSIDSRLLTLARSGDTNAADELEIQARRADQTDALVVALANGGEPNHKRWWELSKLVNEGHGDLEWLANALDARWPDDQRDLAKSWLERGADGAPSVRAWPLARSLSLSFERLDGQRLEKILTSGDLSAVTALTLDYNGGLGSKGCTILAAHSSRLPSLRHLSLAETNPDPDGLERLGASPTSFDCMQTAPVLCYHFAGNEWEVALTIPATGDDLEVVVEVDGVMHSATFTPEWSRFSPNGEECGPTCARSAVTMDIR